MTDTENVWANDVLPADSTIHIVRMRESFIPFFYDCMKLLMQPRFVAQILPQKFLVQLLLANSVMKKLSLLLIAFVAIAAYARIASSCIGAAGNKHLHGRSIGTSSTGESTSTRHTMSSRTQLKMMEGGHFDMKDYHVLSMDAIGGKVTDHGVALDIKDIAGKADKCGHRMRLQQWDLLPLFSCKR